MTQIETNRDDETLSSLRSQLEELGRRRKQVQLRRQQIQQEQERIEDLGLSLQLEENLQNYQSILHAQHTARQFLQSSQTWSVTNDCCFIDTCGPWLAMNGARLGGQVPAMQLSSARGGGDRGHPSSGNSGNSVNDASGNATANTLNASVNTGPSSSDTTVPTGTATGTTTTNHTSAATSITARRYLPWGSHLSHHNAQQIMLHKLLQSHETATSNSPPPSWQEINAALGDCCLLLQLLVEQNILSLPCTLVPQGMTSKIISKNNETAHLFYNPDAPTSSHFVFLQPKTAAWRCFGQGINHFLHCLREAGDQLSDKTLRLPHDMIPQENSRQYLLSWKIGGVLWQWAATPPPVGALEEDSTRALSYVLTNLKWLVVYAAKHVEV